MNKVTGRNHLGRRTRSCDHSIQRFTVLAWALPGSCLELCLLCLPVSLGLSVSRAGSPSATPQPFPSSNKSPSIPHFPLLTLQISSACSTHQAQDSTPERNPVGKAWIPPSQRRVYSFVFTFIIFFFTPHYKLTRREKLQFLGSEVRKYKKKKTFSHHLHGSFLCRQRDGEGRGGDKSKCWLSIDLVPRTRLDTLLTASLIGFHLPTDPLYRWES